MRVSGPQCSFATKGVRHGKGPVHWLALPLREALRAAGSVFPLKESMSSGFLPQEMLAQGIEKLRKWC